MFTMLLSPPKRWGVCLLASACLLGSQAMHVQAASPHTLTVTTLDDVFFDVTVRGKITDETNQPLPGATISVQGTSRGTVSDIDGEFSIVVPENATLVISFIGYETQMIRITNQTVLNIKMQQDASAMEEVVVIGYGTQRKSDLTGSVGSVGAQELSERPAPSLNQALAGRVAGVQVNTNSGHPRIQFYQLFQ